MKPLKTALVIFMILSLVIISSGCWDYEDVNKLFVVMGIGIDKDQDTGEYILVTEVVKAIKGAETEIKVRVTTARGNTIFEAIRNSIQEIGAKLYWGHTLVFMFSTSIARDEMMTVLDTFQRLPQIKSDVQICVTGAVPIDEVFKIEDPIHQSISQHLAELLNYSEHTGKYVNAPFNEVIHDFSMNTRSVALPYFEVEQHGEEKALMIEGSIVYKHDMMMAILDEVETRSLDLIKGKLISGYEVSLPAEGSVPALSVEVINTKRSLKHTLSDGALSLKLDFTIDCDMVELQTADPDYMDENLGLLETALETSLKTQMQAIIGKAQNELQTDIFCFGEYVFTKIPEYWRTVASDWNTVFCTVPVEISIKVNILSGGTQKPLLTEE